MNWFYAKDGQPAGPIDESDLERLAEAGAIQDATLVWRSGMPEWKRYSEVRPRPPALPLEASGSSQTLAPPAPAALIVPGALPYAGFWIRAVAWMFDGLIMLPVSITVFLVFFIKFPDFLSSNANEGGGTRAFFEFTLLAISALYETLFVGRFGATPGKWVCDLGIVRSDGSAISYTRALCRHFAKRLSWFIFLIGYLIAAFDMQKRALHDYLCDTRVVHR